MYDTIYHEELGNLFAETFPNKQKKKKLVMIFAIFSERFEENYKFWEFSQSLINNSPPKRKKLD